MQKVHLIPHEVAIIAWITAWFVDMPEYETQDIRHPSAILTSQFSREELHAACTAIEANFNGPGFCWIAGPADHTTREILRVAVENNDYAHACSDFEADVLYDIVAAFQSLAFKLRDLDIEVSSIPSLTDGSICWSEPALACRSLAN